MSAKENNMNKKYYILIIASFLTAALLAGFFLLNKKLLPEKINNTEISLPTIDEETKPDTQAETTDAISAENKNITKPVPKSLSLEVPFISQAPYAVWDTFHEDACEEASLIMIEYFKKGTSAITKETVEKEIQDMTKYETSVGLGPSITLAQLNIVALNYYQLSNGKVVENSTVDNIKAEILAGRPVIIPVAGKILPNPNFRNGGPVYHMLVIKGFNETGFITNDPGTRKGNNFWYTYNVLMNAIHDWNPDNILNGRKAYLVFD